MTEQTLRPAIDARFRKARLERDERTKNLIGLLKNKVLVELKSGKDVVEDDTLWTAVLQSYAKQSQKAIAEFEKVGERGAELLDEARFELAFCEEYLPKKLDEAATEALVRQVIEAGGLSGKKSIGRVMGAVLKQHRDQVDAALVREIADRLLE
ncbi:MAG: GatB/YqeY domain-containing protein [Myxococcales bacterium]|nr:GatB/YqeY domain-containing protein [Myxococcales bacterium]